MTVRNATRTERDKLARLLAHAFGVDPVMRHIFPRDPEWERGAAPYFELTLGHTLDHGVVLTNENTNGVSLWEPPNLSVPFLSRAVSLFKVVGIFRQNLARALRVQQATEKHRPSTPHWYLTYVATDPSVRGQGVGGALLEPMLELADRENLPVYLECSNEINISFYVAHGFNLTDEILLPEGPKVWPMLRQSPRPMEVRAA